MKRKRESLAPTKKKKNMARNAEKKREKENNLDNY